MAKNLLHGLIPLIFSISCGSVPNDLETKTSDAPPKICATPPDIQSRFRQMGDPYKTTIITFSYDDSRCNFVLSPGQAVADFTSCYGSCPEYQANYTPANLSCIIDHGNDTKTCDFDAIPR